ncbi:MAG: hypothetical protein HY248_01860, partial [Fimbriimonas ginsengisoli]|nr:hypothetical protein [Fimbriimonas ginsengisoli]
MIDPLKIHALADAELSKEDAEALAHEIAKCRRSTLELETIQGLKLIVNKHCQPVACDDTWCKCRKRLDEIDRAQRVEGFVGRYAWGLCGTFLLAIVVGGLATRNGSAGLPRKPPFCPGRVRASIFIVSGSSNHCRASGGCEPPGWDNAAANPPT